MLIEMLGMGIDEEHLAFSSHVAVAVSCHLVEIGLTQTILVLAVVKPFIDELPFGVEKRDAGACALDDHVRFQTEPIFIVMTHQRMS